MADKNEKTERTVELIPIHTVVVGRMVKKQGSDDEELVEETHPPGTPDKPAKPFRVPASEAERLLKLGAVKRADEKDEEQ